jgi:hypothetical protein
VYEALYKDLGDGLPPLCSVNHERPDLEGAGAIPVIFPVNAVGGNAASGTDPNKDSEQAMVRYAEVEWEQRNVKILVSNITEGVQAYKRVHRIKDDTIDQSIAIPYRDTKKMAVQISNLRKKQTASGFTVERATKSVQKDLWSAAEYALRGAQRLEYENLAKGTKENEWTRYFQTGELPKPKATNPYANVNTTAAMPIASRGIGRTGGNFRK